VPDRIIPTFGYNGGPRGEMYAVLDGIGRLWLQGVDIDWVHLHQGGQPRRVSLPAYAFDRKRYWIERRGGLGRMSVGDSGMGARAEVATMEEPVDAISAYSRPKLRNEYVSPENEIETKLVEIWRSYLGIEDIGTKDNFFELGGDSLLASRVYAQIKKDLDVEMPMGKMFEFATIRRIYLYIAASDPQSIDALSEEELDDFLAVMES
jgi:acyl carrier protein